MALAEIALLLPLFAVRPIPIAAFALETFALVQVGRIALAAFVLELGLVDLAVPLDWIEVAVVLVAVAFVADTAAVAQVSFVGIALALAVVVLE